MSETDVVIVEDRETHLEVTINRPAKRNAINQEVVDKLAAAWEQFEQGPWAAAVVTGAGDQAFSAGADLYDPPHDDDPAYPNFGTPVTKPVVAAVEGYAIGAGFVLSQASDICVAGDQAQFAYPETRIGTTGGGASLLTTRVPAKAVYDLVLTARRWPADRALAAGLVSEVVPAGQALAKARELAGLLAENDRDALLALKALLDADVQRSGIETAQRISRATRHTVNRDKLASVLSRD